MSRRKTQAVGVERLLEAIGVKVRSHAEAVPSVGLGKIALPFPNVCHHRGAAAFQERCNIAGVTEIDGIEVTIARPL